jgi:hypothetical protein
MDPKEKRDKIWDYVWRLGYNCCFSEASADFMLKRWLATDHICRIVIALFTAGSGLAGWTLWSTADGKNLWALLAGVATILSIVMSTFTVQERIKRFAESKHALTDLRIKIKSVIVSMSLDPEFDCDSLKASYDALTDNYSKELQRFPDDLFFGTKARDNVQTKIGNLIETTDVLS